MTDVSEYIPPIKVHITSSDVPEKRPKELRVTHKSVVLNASNPYQMIAGVDPARKKITFSAVTNNIVISGGIGQASDQSNVAATIATPNGRYVAGANDAGPFDVEGPNEVWSSTGTYPTI